MKRSEINLRIREGIAFFDRMGFKLPPFAFFTREDWQNEAADAAEIFDLQLGWDVTAFGGPDFLRTGLLLFTLRNGRAGDGRYRKPYAEKIMMVRENQVTPCHFHWKKCEDIINRGGGNLVVELYHADPTRNRLVSGSFPISVNGLRRTMEPGEKLILTPGESVCLESIHAHRFYGEPGRGEVLVGEVSMVNDDENDNCFLDGVIRFDPVEEDEPPEWIPAADYRKFVTEADHA
ncbi:D-lyxose/D-mannose family sugar isomerase [Victivallis vadensis]|uniref:D-lyxose/D-mannose family sugar isomerase n=1 Tax=Victivallis vadensis TaxID=172901 RepID=UPI0023FA0C92|nr:D-lyxose/D-mannose family sugar isomerase [Victivallis vadensis]